MTALELHVNSPTLRVEFVGDAGLGGGRRGRRRLGGPEYRSARWRPKVHLLEWALGGRTPCGVVATDPRFAGGLKGVIAMSGVYDVGEIGAFKSDSANASPIHRIAPGMPPFLITFCENEYPYLPAQAREFEQALKAKSVSAELVYVTGKNHINEIVDVYPQRNPTARTMLQFIAQHRCTLFFSAASRDSSISPPFFSGAWCESGANTSGQIVHGPDTIQSGRSLDGWVRSDNVLLVPRSIPHDAARIVCYASDLIG